MNMLEDDIEGGDFLEAPKSSERPMRRKDRELSRTDALRIIRAAEHAVISTADSTGVPYGVPVTPALEGETKLYFHSSRAVSRRADNMLDNPSVSVLFTAHAQTVPEEFSVNYATAIVAGRAALVLARHAPDVEPETIAKRLDEGLRTVSVWRVDIERVSGKSRGWDRISPMLAEKGYR